MSDTALPPPDTSDLIERLDRGDLTVVDPLLTRHQDKLRGVAREAQCRYGLSEAECGDDDAVIDAYAALWRLAGAGKLGPITSREGYWNKICGLVRRQVRLVHDRLTRRKRGGSGVGRTAPRQVGDQPGAAGATIPATPRRRGLDEVDEERLAIPSAEKAVDDADELERIIERLPVYGEILALMRDGHTSDEIATRLGYSSRTFRRRLERLRGFCSERGLIP